MTSVEVPKSKFKTVDYDMKSSPSQNNSGSSSSRLKRKDIEKRKITESVDNNETITLVVSGGDGYEDFRYNQQSESVGRDDSINHLLIWRV